jgi:hypothetical protein
VGTFCRACLDADTTLWRDFYSVYYGKGKDDVVLVDGDDKLTVHSVEMPE